MATIVVILLKEVPPIPKRQRKSTFQTKALDQEKEYRSDFSFDENKESFNDLGDADEQDEDDEETVTKEYLYRGTKKSS